MAAFWLDGAFLAGRGRWVDVEHFYHEQSSTLTYVVYDRPSGVAIVIDPVLDFDLASGTIGSASAERVAAFLETKQLRLRFALDTHAHADHLSAVDWFRSRLGAETVIGAEIVAVQTVFRDLFNLAGSLDCDGRQFDRLLAEGDKLDVGPFEIEALHTPGHTPACMSYRIGGSIFVGDTLFQPDYGTARCDFPGGSASRLFTSIQRLYRELPSDLRVYTCHDYRPGGRPMQYESTIAEQASSNRQLSSSTTLEEFVAFRQARDATLSMPLLILPAIQVNIRGGQLPPPESNGLSYLKLPLNAFGSGR